MSAWIDLSVPVVTGMPVYPGDPAVEVSPALRAPRDGVNVLQLQISLIEVLIQRYFGFGMEPFVLNVPLDVRDGGDGGEHDCTVETRSCGYESIFPLREYKGFRETGAPALEEE